MAHGLVKLWQFFSLKILIEFDTFIIVFATFCLKPLRCHYVHPDIEKRLIFPFKFRSNFIMYFWDLKCNFCRFSNYWKEIFPFLLNLKSYRFVKLIEFHISMACYWNKCNWVLFDKKLIISMSLIVKKILWGVLNGKMLREFIIAWL